MTRFMNMKIFTLLVFFLSAVVVISALMIAGCSSANKEALVDADTGKHVANWYFEHRVAYLTNPSQCYSCHGTDLHGGISGVSCFTASFNGISCHANGPSGHPLGWISPDSHGAAAKTTPNAGQGTGFSTCQICHGANFTGGQANRTCLNTAGCHGANVGAPHSPAPWRQVVAGVGRTHTNTDTANAAACALCHLSPGASAPPGCFNNTLCHAQVGHPLGWALPDNHGPAAKSTPNAGQGTGFSSCQICHGTDFTGGLSNQTCLSCHGVAAPHSPAPWRQIVAGVGRTHTNTDTANAAVCALCHLRPGATDSPSCYNNTLCHAQVGVCGTCHALPPDGAASPNTAGRHAVHAALAHVGADCTVCHSGAGSGTGLHINGTAEVAFTTTYAARPIAGGTPSFNTTANTCSNVSCHGGQTTPNWLTGTITVNTQCTLCHVSGTTQYNSYNSGRHNLHINNEGIGCTECHDTAKLATVHFNDLNTSAMTQANLTLLNSLNYTGTSCDPACHGSENW